MKLHDLFEGEVIRGRFGSSSGGDGIQPPPGYDSFYTKQTSDRVWAIMGIKSNGAHVQISTTNNEQLADAICKEYNTGGQADTGIESVSLTQAFGASDSQVLEQLNIVLREKPSSFSELEYTTPHYRPLGEFDIHRINRALGYTLDEIMVYDIYDRMPRYPMDQVERMPLNEHVFIIDFDDGRRYLVDRSGASSYIRHWAKIN